MQYFTCKNGVVVPLLGLGTWRAEKGQAQAAVCGALQHGYRLIDTASFYENEREVGAGILESGIKREDIFITSKVWVDDSGYDDTLRAFDKSITKLGVDYLDMYMVHWPVQGLYKETYRALETLYLQKRIRVLGVSNFPLRLMQEMQTQAEVPFMVNQLQFHPLYIRKEEYAYAKEHGILLQAWKPLARGLLSKEPQLVQIASSHQKTVEQVLLRWAVQLGLCVIPKTTNKQRLSENMDIFDFELTQSEMEMIGSFDKGESLSSYPESAVMS